MDKKLWSEFNERYDKKYDDVLDKEWDAFREELLHENRFFITSPIVEKISNLIKKLSITIPTSVVLFRARIYKGDVKAYDVYRELYKFLLEKGEEGSEVDRLSAVKSQPYGKKFKTSFWGYDEEDSFVPKQKNNKGGRANPEMINYLYASDSKYTVLTEVRPGLNDYVSIADIKILKELNIIDFSNSDVSSMLSEREKKLFDLINSAFSEIDNGDNSCYFVTQYISELVKKSGADGLRHNSAMYSDGKNYVIFNYEKCKAVRSNLYKMSDICLAAERVGPVEHSYFRDQEKSLMHPKLKAYKSPEKS